MGNPADAPLQPHEERFWRALMRVLVALPRGLDDDLLRGTGLTLTEYTVLMHLSEAGNRELRMTDLAAATALSASRITRVVDSLQSRGLVAKRRHAEDARGNVAGLTDKGFERLVGAWPAHLASARRRVIDHLDCAALDGLADQFVEVAAKLDPGGPTRPC
ncbi:MarR family winged helix-turn-helix transcriptional regulator [Streptomyces radicis]|uniref:MarR family transcriptional regulator n=1 Tax=Streptomyces radicis TaxID=1750517 RepID=A0A3A9W1B2_9ACTN|nr:MarR family winged helix-turn-helix transcriptional regulator [Streptomyces radicis]RKN07015.1 MarR family transcriptional regulator [Streptomyces radicis]RKN15076.1 MarR family transcriptional regulator [Streptomyces radicis]